MDIDALPAVTPSVALASDAESAVCARRPLSPASSGCGDGGGGDNFDGNPRWAYLLNCCSCGEELCDGPLLLACLHVCCRKCFNAASNAAGYACGGGGGGDKASAAGKRAALCAACQRDSATAAAVPATSANEGNSGEPLDNFLVESLVRARRMRTGVAVCGFCKDDGDDSSGAGVGKGDGNGKSKQQGAAAAHWCIDCARYMCSRCFLFHGRFNAAHLVFTPGATTQQLLPVLCRQHGDSVCSLYCCRCERLLCRECSQRCLADAHDVVRVGGEQATVAARRLADELQDACSKLEEKARRLAELNGGGEGGTPAAAAEAAAELDEARRRDLATQDENYRLALDIVEEAYREALAALDKLNGCANGGTAGVDDRKEVAKEKKEHAAAAAEKAEEDEAEEERLLRSLEHALEFTAALLDPARGGGGMDLLQFHEPAERRLRALCDRADRFLAAAAAEAPAAAVPTQQPKATEATPERRVVVECHQPSNFGDVALNWIGVPRQQTPVGDETVDRRTAELSPGGDSSDSLAVQLRNASISPASSANAAVAAANVAAAAADDRPRVLHFGSVRRRIDVPFAHALGMSVSADGHVLVAASLDGLVEYDTEAGCGGYELSRWLPPPELGDDVRAVECLEDGRVAVAVVAGQAAADVPSPSAAACTLVLLGKPDDGGVAAWCEVRRLALRCRALRMAACGETLAVLGIATHHPESGISATADDGCGGRNVDLLCTYDGQSLLSRTLDYAVCAVALTARAVVLASAGRRDADFDGRGLGGEFSLEAYSYEWTPLWQRYYTYPVRDVCPQPLGYVLYISCGSDDDGGGGYAMKTVVAVSAEDGGYLCDLVHEPSAEGDAASIDGAILAYDGLRAQLALMPRVGSIGGGVSVGATSLDAVVELRPATVFK